VIVRVSFAFGSMLNWFLDLAQLTSKLLRQAIVPTSPLILPNAVST